MAFEVKKLSEVCRLINGRAYKKPEMLQEGKYPLLRVGNFFSNRAWYYSDLELNEDKYCDDGDLLYAWSASFGPRIWDGGKVIYHYHIWKIELDEALVDKGYLFHLLDWDTEQIKSEQGTGSTMMHVTKGSMENRRLPFPLIPEQKRIVAILDQTFADIELARAKTEQNLKNARELFDSYLHQVFGQLGDDCELRSMSDKTMLTMIDGDRGKNYPKKSEFQSEGHCLFLSTKNVRPDGFLFERTMFIDEARDNLLRKGKLARNDVILTTRGTIGNLALFDETVEYENIRINSGMLILRPNTEVILPSYLFEIMRSGIVRRQIEAKVSGAAQPQLPVNTLNTFSFPVPVSLDGQQRVVGLIREAEVAINELSNIYTKKLASLDELKKSILQKAFSGELTKDDNKEAAA